MRERWLGAFLVVTGCAGTTTGPNDAPKTHAVSIRFKGVVGALPFSCTSAFSSVGSSATTWNPGDFRFYVHNLKLVSSSGQEVAVTLDQDGVWQTDNVAMIDFEDKSGGCSDGTTETRDVVLGTVPEGTYSGLKLTLGVPFEKNHLNMDTQKSPLNLSSMFWGWTGGYKFLRVDGNSTGQPNGFSVHLGSQGCTTAGDGSVTSCSQGNRPEWTFANFSPDTNVVVADIARLFAGVDLDHNAAGSPPGCFSDATDGDCAQVFVNLGLDVQSGNSTTQTASFLSMQ